jgi:putative phosphoesterase
MPHLVNAATDAMSEAVIIGVISDTHGLLRPSAVEALRGLQLILHAGDIGDCEILDRLRQLAPVVAVRGNTDRGLWCEDLPDTEVVECAGLQLYLLHDRQQLDLNPDAAGFAAVIYGHSHRPEQQTRNGVLYFNPGSAGPRRFKLPISLGRIYIEDGGIRGELISLSE